MKQVLLLILLCLLGTQVFAQTTETEPNNLPGQANTIPIPASLTNCKFDQSNDVDWYKIHMPKEGVFIVNIPSNTNTFEFVIEVYDSTFGNYIVYEQATNPGLAITAEALASNTGTYYIKVRRSGTWSDKPYNLNIIIDTSDKCEFNHHIATACPISLGNTISAKIRGYNWHYKSTSSYDWDYYVVNVDKCGVLEANIPVNNTNIALSIDFYDSTGKYIKSNNANGSGSAVNLEAAVSKGKWYLRVDRHLGDRTSANNYNLTVTLDTSDITECNNSFSNANRTKICDTTYATIRPDEDDDFFVFEGNGNGQDILIEASNVPSNMILFMSVYDKNSTQLGSNYSLSLGQTVSMTLQNSLKEDYYVVIEQFNTSGSKSLYQLSISDSMCGITDVKKSEMVATKLFTVSPNPNNGTFIIELNGNENMNAMITITDVMGRIIKKLPIRTGKTDIQLNKPSGMYFLTIESDDFKHTEMLIIQ